MRHVSERFASGPLRWSWVIAGLLMVLLGTGFLATLVLAPVGLGMIILGMAVIMAAVIRAKTRKRRHARANRIA
jgi:heme A synthase